VPPVLLRDLLRTGGSFPLLVPFTGPFEALGGQ